MYNSALNDRCIEQFAGALQGKRVLLVGNSASLFSSDKHGELIDSYDFVLRFGKGFPSPTDALYLGTKTDAWFFGAGRAGMVEKFKAVRWKIYTPSQLKIYVGAEDVLLNKRMYDGSFQIYRDFFMTGPSTDILALNEKVNKTQSNEARLSQGIQCIDWLINRVKVPELTLIGFDFFGKQFNYNFDNRGEAKIPKFHPTSSWHCPLVSEQYETNPHAFSLDGVESNEKKYILSLPGIKHIEMPPIDLEKMDEVLKRLRGKGSSIVR